MRKNLHRVSNRIIRAISAYEIRRARRMIALTTATLLSSAIGTWYAWLFLGREFYQSSFYDYFSLLFSDTDIILSHWRELALSLVESAPLLSMTISLAVVAALLASVRLLSANMAKIETPLLSK